MRFFKKKLKKEEAKDLLSDVLAQILKASGLTLKDVLDKFLLKRIGIQIPSLALELTNVDISKEIAKLIADRLDDDAAYLALMNIKTLLDEYKL